MKKRNKLIYVLIILLIIVFSISEYKEYKHEKMQECIIEQVSRTSYDNAVDFCEFNLD